MTLTIQDRLKELRVEHGLTLEQLAEQTNIRTSATRLLSSWQSFMKCLLVICCARSHKKSPKR